MNLLCSAVLLLLLLQGALGAQEDAKKKMHEWTNLRTKIKDNAILKALEEGDACDVSPAETHAYLLLVDLLLFHPNAVLQWTWPRYAFYSAHFAALSAASDKTFCSYNRFGWTRHLRRLVSDNNTCAKCEGLRDAADAQLQTACAYKGNGGSDAPQTPKEGGSIPEPEWTPSEEACEFGWLTQDIVRDLYENKAGDVKTARVLEPCDYFPALAVAYAYAAKLLSIIPEDQRHAEIEEKREFWEDKLRVLKDGKEKELTSCYPGVGSLNYSNGTIATWVEWVCGKDSICISCNRVTAENYEACHFQDSTKEQKLAENCVAVLQKKNARIEKQLNSVAPTHRQFAFSLLVTAAIYLAHPLTRPY